MKPLSLAITSGGTRVPIDDVRLISNISHGATGAAIATHALEIGHRVNYIANSDTCLPYIGNPLSDAWQGLTKDPDRYVRFHDALTKDQLTLTRAESFDEYMKSVESAVKPENRLHAIILSAAVSDFGPSKFIEGKVDSSAGLTLTLSPLPKIRERIRQIHPGIIIVAFKQMPVGTTENDLFKKAESAMERGDIDLTVANLTTSVAGRFSALATWILRKDGTREKIERRELAKLIIEQEIPKYL